MKKNKIYFRADGNAQMGLGHVFRSLALAEMLSENFECHFVIRNPLPILKTQILAVCNTIIELPETEDFTPETTYLLSIINKNDIIVLDGYHFVTDYQKAFKNQGVKVVCIDDIHAYHFVADIIINHIGGKKPSDYSAEYNTKFYLGLDYALLRKPFRDVAQQMRELNEGANNIFICFGGADPHNDTLIALEKCETTKSVENCIVILGAAYKHQKQLNEFLKRTRLNVNLYSNISAAEMIDLMAQSQKAITPPSTISYEYLSVMPKGELYLKTTADNQIDVFNFFIKNKYCHPFTDFGKSGLDKLCTETIFDGKQKNRFINILKSIL